MKAAAFSNPGAGAWTNRIVVGRAAHLDHVWNRARREQEGLAMSKHSAMKTLTAILSVATIGAALSFGMGTVRAEDKDKNVTEDQILRALAPEKKPLTRGLSVGPQQQIDPAAAAAEGKF